MYNNKEMNMTAEITDTKQFWNRKVNRVFDRFFIDGDVEGLIQELGVLGFDPDVVQDVYDEWRDEYECNLDI
jgi:hypothetical protein